jgi:outer membrane protein OmpA-like peptidoglycan-associated protein
MVYFSAFPIFTKLIVIFITCWVIGIAPVWGQQETPEPPAETTVPDPSTSTVEDPESYAWYQYSPTDTLPADTRIPPLPRWSFTLTGGNMGYMGDLNQGSLNPLSTGFQAGLGLQAAYHLSPLFALSLEGYRLPFKISGIGYEFTTKGSELSLNLVLDITRTFPNYFYKPRKLHLYAFAGPGFCFFKTNLTRNSVQRIIDPTSDLLLATGLKLGYRIKPQAEIGFIFSYRYVNTDILDGYASLQSGNDSYSYLGLSFTWHLLKSPKTQDDLLQALKKEVLQYVTKDIDQDGVPDYLDQDGNTPFGELVDATGKPLDTDGDGVPDTKDKDPFSATGLEVDENGVPPDSDGDGVPDYRDESPSDAAGSISNFQGKSIVVPKNNIPPPEKPKSTPDIIKKVLSNWNLSLIYFSEGSVLVGDKYYHGLSELAFILQGQPDLQVKVIGHTDATGTQKVNQQLGKARALEVIRILTEVYGINKNRFTYEIAAAAKPLLNVAGQKDSSAMNRRVEIRLTFEGQEVK